MKWAVAALLLASVDTLAMTFTTEDLPPFNFTIDGGVTMTGSASDVVNEMLKRSGLKARIVLHPWQRAYKMALDNEDVCVYSTVRTEARENLFKWVGPVATDNWVVFAKAGSNVSITELDDLKRLKVGAYQGDAKAAFLRSRGIAADEAIREELNAKKLDAGRLDVWVAGSMTGPWMAKTFGVKIKPIFAIQQVQMYLACNLAVPDGEIVRMNDAVKSIKADGSFDRFVQSYQ